MSQFKFIKAVRKQAKARIAITGPSGSGKTTLALIGATILAGGTVEQTPTGYRARIADDQVALVDTENESASLYSDAFNFNALEFSAPYDPRQLVEANKAAKEAGHKVVVDDSITAFWNGEGGTLDIVDAAGAKMGGNRYAGWKDGTPVQNRLMDNLRGLGIHTISTMRSKMEYVQEKDERGKSSIRKLGLAPIQRDGAEYEFDVVLDVDLDHNVIASKSRCPLIADRLYRKDQVVELFVTLRDWLESGEAVVWATDDEVKEVRSLAAGLGFTEGQLVGGLFKYAGVNSFSALTSEGAQNVIEALEAAAAKKAAAKAPVSEKEPAAAPATPLPTNDDGSVDESTL